MGNVSAFAFVVVGQGLSTQPNFAAGPYALHSDAEQIANILRRSTAGSYVVVPLRYLMTDSDLAPVGTLFATILDTEDTEDRDTQ